MRPTSRQCLQMESNTIFLPPTVNRGYNVKLVKFEVRSGYCFIVLLAVVTKVITTNTNNGTRNLFSRTNSVYMYLLRGAGGGGGGGVSIGVCLLLRIPNKQKTK